MIMETSVQATRPQTVPFQLNWVTSKQNTVRVFTLPVGPQIPAFVTDYDYVL